MAAAVRVGFVGAGKMAQALARGFLAAGLTKGSNIVASCPPQDEHLLKEFQALGAQTTHSNASVAQQCDVVVLAVKPHVMPAVLDDMRASVTSGHVVLSIAAGVSVQSIEDRLEPGCRVLRAMPNTAVQVRCGASVLVRGTSATDEDARTTSALLRAVGSCDLVAEQLVDAVTALSACGPAYLYVAAEAMADGAVKMGVPRDLAQRLAAQTVAGAGRMAVESGRHPAQLKEDVMTPGGCTAAAIHRLEDFRFRAALMGAVEAATLHNRRA
ncbi:pyrroline-5-carboxylate reductase 3-like [Bacillus rossius redtenbacheri]|uniref:pyrroline-5-carboxylate reductase 3-like n=1 Tax=Bacillus rossius redtenbacheri TaxID=93214 RepID=UPI002FDD77CD